MDPQGIDSPKLADGSVTGPEPGSWQWLCQQLNQHEVNWQSGWIDESLGSDRVRIYGCYDLGKVESAIRDLVTQAVQAERAACIAIAERWALDAASASDDTDSSGDAAIIADEIRSRG